MLRSLPQASIRTLLTNSHAKIGEHAQSFCRCVAYGTWNLQKLSSWKATSDSMISRAMKSHTNEHAVRDRPALKVVKRFRNGSVCIRLKRYQFTSEHFVLFYQESCYTKGAINGGYQFHLKFSKI